MENQHRKLKGYRELSQAEIDSMNQIKELAAKTGELIQSFDGPVPGVDGEGAFFPDPEWLKEAKKTLQTGFMQLTRAIAKPDFF